MIRLLIILLSVFCSQVFASNYGSFVYFDKDTGSKNITYEKISGYAVAEGDIILKKLENVRDKKSVSPQAVVLMRLGGGRWPNGEMPYKISDEFSPQCQYTILSAMVNWSKDTKIKFIELDKNDFQKYPGYVYFVPSYSTTNSSYVGFQGGEQVIKISSVCKEMTVAHEIGHALGLWHEQSRSDRDNYIQIMWDNIEPEHIFNFNQHLRDGQDIGEYDYSSVMHYSAYAFSKNGEKTIIPLLPNVEIGQRNRISKKDFAAVNYMYQAQ